MRRRTRRSLPPFNEAGLDTWAQRKVALLREVQAEDWCGHFPDLCRRELLEELGLDAPRVRFLEAECAIGNFADAADHSQMRAAVSRRLRREGYRLPRGKRSPAHRQAFAKRMAAMLELLGVPFGCNDHSHMTEILCCIWSLGLAVERGDLRSDLRAIKRERMQIEAAQRKAMASFYAAFAAGLRGDVAPPLSPESSLATE